MKYLKAVLIAIIFTMIVKPGPPALTKVVHHVSSPKKEIVSAQAPAAQPQPEQSAIEVPQTPVVTPANHVELMASAGINPADYGAVDYIVSHESSWNADATEPTTGAHGLPQALPYSKTGCGWSDPICQLHWANDYAISRYGSWGAAMSYWQLHRNW